MFRQAEYKSLLNGEQKGMGAALMRFGLQLGEPLYAAGVWWRNRGYDRGRRPVHRAAAPVVCVGNLTVGGTGKTPLVEWLARWMRERGVRAAIVSRGYGAEEGSLNDEALELEQKLPDVPHVQNPDRVEAARTAVEELDSRLILLDDGFQHRRLARDLDIVLIDALEPFGYGHLLPRGLLREPLSALRRAHAVVLSRADLVDAAERRRIREVAARHAPSAAWAEVAHKPAALIDCDGRRRELSELRGRRVAAFCGIGNPAAFCRTLESCGCELAALREFPDHHAYGEADIDSLLKWLRELHDVEAVVCTHKDLVKVGLLHLGSCPLWALIVGIEFLSGAEALEALLAPLAERAAGEGPIR
jgi:tetraacyldisaccharide 4'-kinase